MIKIVVTGKCEGCEDKKLKLFEWDASTLEKKRYLYAICCEHKDVCDKWEKEIAKQAKADVTVD